jgi:VCBS repeat-containing protein
MSEITGNSTKYLGRTITNTGEATWTAGSISAIAGGSYNNLPEAIFDVQGNSTLSTSTFTNAGILRRSVGTGTATIGAALNNTGSVQVQSGVLQLTNVFTQTAGETILDGGDIANSNPLDIRDGLLAGSGSISGDVTTSGRTAPGLTEGDTDTVEILGNYILSPTVDAGGPYSVNEGGLVQLNATVAQSRGALEVEIGSATAFDQLDVDGDVVLAGSLEVSLIGGYQPAIGDTFTVINNLGTGSIVGAFAGLPEGATFTVDGTQFQITYSGGASTRDVVLTAIEPTLPDQGGDTLQFEWDLDGDNIYGETGEYALRGDEIGGSVLFSAVDVDGPVSLTVGVRATFGAAQSPVATAVIDVDDVAAIELPDLTVSAANISFTPENPVPGETVTISATIKNQGLIAATDIDVAFLNFDAALDSMTVNNLDPGETAEVVVSTVFPVAGFQLITVDIDPNNAIEELYEENNEASQVLRVGTPDASTAEMIVLAANPADVCQLTSVSISGSGNYDFETVNQNFPVQGGRVSITVVDSVTDNVVGVFTGSVTDNSGNFRQLIVSPSTEGTYSLLVQITDDTVIGEYETTLHVVSDSQCQDQPDPDPDPVPTINLNIAAGAISELDGAQATTATVTRRNFADISSELTVTLSSSDTSEATVPLQVVIPAGAASATFHIAAIDDDLIDGSQRVTITAQAAGLIGRDTLLVTDNETAPPPPPSGAQDIRVLADDIIFSNENPEVGEPITILASIHYTGSAPAMDIPVTFNDIYPIDGQLRTVPIGATTVSFPNGGTGSPVFVGIPWTNQSEGVHVIQVVTEPAFQQTSTVNDSATRSIVIGSDLPPDVVVNYQDPPALMNDSDNNGVLSPGDTIRYTIQYASSSDQDLTGVTIFDDFDQNLVGTPFNIFGNGLVDQGAITWDIGTISAGASGSVSYDVVIKPAAEFPSGTNLIASTVFLTSEQTVPILDSIQVGVVLETTPPTTTATRSPAANLAGWNNSDLNVVLSAVDQADGSGVSLIVYSIDDGTPVIASGDNVTLPFTDEGIHAVTYYAVDAALNAESPRTIEVRVDKTAPVAAGDSGTVFEGGTVDILDGGASSVLGNDDDPLSGVTTVELVSGPSFATAFSLNPDGTFSYTHDDSENHADSFTYRVFDLAGNSSDAVVTLNIDGVNDDPVITVGGNDSAAESLTETDLPLAADGTLSVGDVDVGDVVDADVVSVTVDGVDGGISLADLLNMLSIANNPVVSAASTEGVIEWHFDSGTQAFDHLAAGESLELTYLVRATDAAGAEALQTVLISVNGTNDAPQVSLDDVLPTVENDFAQLSGTIADLDSSDTFTLDIDWGHADSPPVTESIDLSNPPAHVTWDPLSRQFSVTHQYLDDAPTGAQAENYTIGVTVTDSAAANNSSGSNATPVMITNALPQVTSALDQDVDEGVLLDIVVATFTDVGTLDTHASQIDWGDGSPAIAGDVDPMNDTVAGEHVYADNGIYTVTVLVADDDMSGDFVDGVEGVDFVKTTFVVTVGNRAPTFDAGMDQDTSEGVAVSAGAIQFNELGTLDTHTATIDWGDSTDIDYGMVVESPTGPSGSTAGIDGTVVFPTHVYAQDGIYTVTVSVKDDDQDQPTIDTFTVTVINSAPTFDAGATRMASEGAAFSAGEITFNDLGTLDTHVATINWGDGTETQSGLVSETPFGPGGSTSGANGSVIFADHIYPDDGVYTVEVTITDDDETTTEFFDVVVSNQAPVINEASLVNSSPECGLTRASDTVDIAVDFSDPGFDNPALGTAESFAESTIDWGDGTIETVPAIDVTTVDGGPLVDTTGQISGTHAYATGGIFTVTITVTDDDGDSDVLTTQVVTTGVGLVGDTLYVIGTEGEDKVDIKLKGSDGDQWINVKGTFDKKGDKEKFDVDFSLATHTINNIVVLVCGGDDKVTVDKDLDIDATIDGGAGDDKLKGGGGNDTILGGDGEDDIKGYGGDDLIDGGNDDDKLDGGRGSDILLGGDGDDDLKGGSGSDGDSDGDADNLSNDVLSGGNGDDKLDGGKGWNILVGGDGKDKLKGKGGLFIGGYTTHDDDAVALGQIRDIWISGDSYDDVVDQLTGSNGLLEVGSQVFGDDDRDELDGDKHAADLFFAELGLDRLKGEDDDTIVPIFATND